MVSVGELGERLPQEKGILSSKGLDASDGCLSGELTLCIWAQRRHWELRLGERRKTAFFQNLSFHMLVAKRESGLIQGCK